jgi:hypothetical protein
VVDKLEHTYRGDVTVMSPRKLESKHIHESENRQMSEVLKAWKTSSGFLDNFSMIVDRATFGYNDKYQDGEALLLHLEGKNDEDGAEAIVELPVGKGWAKKDKAGRYCENPENAKADFNDRSFMGMLVDIAILDTDKVHECGINGFGIAELLGQRGMLPTDAHAWKGFHLEFKRHKFKFGTRKVQLDNGGIQEVPIESERLFPVAFLGCEGGRGLGEWCQGEVRHCYQAQSRRQAGQDQGNQGHRSTR